MWGTIEGRQRCVLRLSGVDQPVIVHRVRGGYLQTIVAPRSSLSLIKNASNSLRTSTSRSTVTSSSKRTSHSPMSPIQSCTRRRSPSEIWCIRLSRAYIVSIPSGRRTARLTSPDQRPTGRATCLVVPGVCTLRQSRENERHQCRT